LEVRLQYSSHFIGFWQVRYNKICTREITKVCSSCKNDVNSIAPLENNMVTRKKKKYDRIKFSHEYLQAS